MRVKLNVSERTQFQYILPVQGNLKALELVESIFGKVKISDKDMSDTNKIDNDKELEIDFTKEEMKFMNDSIAILDEQGKLFFQSLSLVKKIKGV